MHKAKHYANRTRAPFFWPGKLDQLGFQTARGGSTEHSRRLNQRGGPQALHGKALPHQEPTHSCLGSGSSPSSEADGQQIAAVQTQGRVGEGRPRDCRNAAWAVASLPHYFFSSLQRWLQDGRSQAPLWRKGYCLDSRPVLSHVPLNTLHARQSYGPDSNPLCRDNGQRTGDRSGCFP